MNKHPVFEKATACPFCNRANELTTSARGQRAPENGDFSLCIGCGEWSVFDAHWSGGTRKPTFAEYQHIVATPFMRRAREAWLATVPVAKRARS